MPVCLATLPAYKLAFFAIQISLTSLPMLKETLSVECGLCVTDADCGGGTCDNIEQVSGTSCDFGECSGCDVSLTTTETNMTLVIILIVVALVAVCGCGGFCYYRKKGTSSVEDGNKTIQMA